MQPATLQVECFFPNSSLLNLIHNLRRIRCLKYSVKRPNRIHSLRRIRCGSIKGYASLSITLPAAHPLLNIYVLCVLIRYNACGASAVNDNGLCVLFVYIACGASAAKHVWFMRQYHTHFLWLIRIKTSLQKVKRVVFFMSFSLK